MGSLEGRLACCAHFWNNGYRDGYRGTDAEAPPLNECMWKSRAYTVSKTFAGLWRNGYIWGIEDRLAGHPFRHRTHDQYRESRIKVRPNAN